MAVLFKSSEPASHWYTVDGAPCHRVPAKSGGDRAVYLRDAVAMKLLPSVTNVLGVLAKPGLDEWKLSQVGLAAARNARGPEESEDYYAKRVVELARRPVEQAADLGTKIHDALEKAFDGEPVPDDMRVYVEPALAWIKASGFGIEKREIVVTNGKEGYAGRVDVIFRHGKNGAGILDYKTRKTVAGKPVTPYDGQAAQLAAYAAAAYGPAKLGKVRILNLYISTTEPGRVEHIEHDGIKRHFEFFKAACGIWRYIKGYDPRVKQA